MMKKSTPSLPKILRPFLIRLQSLLTNTRSNSVQTRLEICEPDRPDLVHGRVQEGFAEVAQGAHGGVFGEGCYVAAGEAYIHLLVYGFG